MVHVFLAQHLNRSDNTPIPETAPQLQLNIENLPQEPIKLQQQFSKLTVDLDEENDNFRTAMEHKMK